MRTITTYGLVAGAFLFARAAQAQQVLPALRADARSLAQICRGDYDRLCASVQPGGGRIVACLQAHDAALTPACRATIAKAKARKPGTQ